MDKAGGGLTYRLRVVLPHVNISRSVTATEYNVTGLRAKSSYTVYVSAVSSGLFGPEESAVGTTGGSECRIIPQSPIVPIYMKQYYCCASRNYLYSWLKCRTPNKLIYIDIRHCGVHTIVSTQCTSKQA